MGSVLMLECQVMQLKGKAMAATLQAGGDIAAQLGLGTGKSAGVAGVMPGKIMAALKGALLGQISSDSKLSDAAKKRDD